MPYLRLDNETIFYTETIPTLPSDTDVTLIPIHGSGGCGAHWPQALSTLQSVHTYIPDLPGHGQSTGNSRTSVEDYADFVEAFVSKLQLKNVILMGHSLGGAIAMISALRRPSWLKGLILVGTGARLRVSPAILDRLASKDKGAYALICDFLFDPNTPKELNESIRDGFNATDYGVTYGDFSACNRFDIMAEVNRIRYPTLIVSGDKDRLTPPKYGKYLHSCIFGSIYTVFKDTGHMMALEKTEEFMDAVRTFLTSVSSDKS